MGHRSVVLAYNILEVNFEQFFDGWRPKYRFQKTTADNLFSCSVRPLQSTKMLQK